MKAVYVYNNPKWQEQIFWPVETALCCRNDALGLLVKIGANVNMGIRSAYQDNATPSTRKSILDAVEGMRAQVEKDLEKAQVEAEEDTGKDKFRELAQQDGWKGALGAHLVKVIEEGETKSVFEPDHMGSSMRLASSSIDPEKVQNLVDSLAYLVRAEELLKAHGAKGWKELFPDKPCDEDHAAYFRSSFHRYWTPSRPTLGFFRMQGSWRFDSVPSHLVASYEELFTACCEGDNAKIEQLCLPPKDGKPPKQQLLQIAARYGEEWGKTFNPVVTMIKEETDNNVGVTPLALALQYRHWSTARLVLAIAVAQYKPADSKPPKFRVRRVLLGKSL